MTKKAKKRTVQSTPEERSVLVAEVLEASEALEQEAMLVFELGRVLEEFVSRPGRPAGRHIILDGQRVTPDDRVVSRVRRLLAERGAAASSRARDLLMLPVADVP